MRWLVVAVLTVVTVVVALTSVADADLVRVDTTPTAETMHGIWGSGPVTLFVGDGGVIARTADDGVTWTLPKSGTNERLNAIGGTGSDVFAVGEGGVMVRSTDLGVTWKAVAHGLVGTPVFRTIWVGAPDDVIVAGSDVLAHSGDRGVTWKRVALKQPQHFLGLHGATDDVTAYAVDGQLMRRTKGVWQSYQGPRAFTAVRSGSHDLLLDRENRVVRTDGTVALPRQGIMMTTRIAASGAVVVVGGSGLWRSAVHGATWSDVAPNKGIWTMALWASPRAWWMTEDSTLWCLVIKGARGARSRCRRPHKRTSRALRATASRSSPASRRVSCGRPTAVRVGRRPRSRRDRRRHSSPRPRRV